MKKYTGSIAAVIAALTLAVVFPSNARGARGTHEWPPDYYNDYYGISGHPSPYYYDGNLQVYYSGDTSEDNPPYDGVDYVLLGYDSGKALRSKTISQDWLAEYLRAHFTNVLLDRRDDFRRGFVEGYGDGAPSVLKEAIQEARHPKPPADSPPPIAKPNEPAKR